MSKSNSHSRLPLPLHLLDAMDAESGLVNVVVDSPKGSRVKYKYEEKTGLFRLSKLLPVGACFPYNFGFVPSTRGEDGDALDMLVLMDEPVPLGCVIPVLPIGVMTALQTERNGETARNDRLIGVVQTQYNEPSLRSLDAMHKQHLEEIEYFFISYNSIEDRQFKPTGRYSADEAVALIKKYTVAE